MKSILNMKVTIFILITMVIVKTNGTPIELDEEFDLDQPYYMCDKLFLRAVSFMCHQGIYNGISEDFRSSKRAIADYCCQYSCTFNSLKNYCNESRYQKNSVLAVQ